MHARTEDCELKDAAALQSENQSLRSSFEHVDQILGELRAATNHYEHRRDDIIDGINRAKNATQRVLGKIKKTIKPPKLNNIDAWAKAGMVPAANNTVQ